MYRFTTLTVLQIRKQYQKKREITNTALLRNLIYRLERNNEIHNNMIWILQYQVMFFHFGPIPE